MRVYALTVAKGGPKLKGTETPESETSGCSGNRQLGLAHRSCKATSMALFAESLPKMSPHYIETPVVNMTDLAGRFDFELSWQPQQLQGRDTGGPGPTIFEALQTQLGLKLESRKLPIPTVVIDKIDRLQAEN